MSGRTAKKLRQLYRRDMAKRAEAQASLVQKRMDTYLDTLEDLLKPAPRFIPDVVWVTLQKLFLNI